MAKNAYHYYGVKDDYAWHFESPTQPKYIQWWQPNLIGRSDVSWCEGPQGGVRVIHTSWSKGIFKKYGYITQNPDEMKEFMWVKLKSVTVSK